MRNTERVMEARADATRKRKDKAPKTTDGPGTLIFIGTKVNKMISFVPINYISPLINVEFVFAEKNVIYSARTTCFSQKYP